MRMNPNSVCDFLVIDKTPDSFGEPRNAWTPATAGVFCEVAPMLGRAYIDAHTQGVTADVRIRCRWIDGVKNDMRVKCGDTMYDIISAINVNNANRELLCYCVKVTS